MAAGSAPPPWAATLCSRSNPRPGCLAHAARTSQSADLCSCMRSDAHGHLSIATQSVQFQGWLLMSGERKQLNQGCSQECRASSAHFEGSVIGPSREASWGPPMAVMPLRSTRPLSLSVSVRTVRNLSSWCRCWPPWCTPFSSSFLASSSRPASSTTWEPGRISKGRILSRNCYCSQCCDKDSVKHCRITFEANGHKIGLHAQVRRSPLHSI